MGAAGHPGVGVGWPLATSLYPKLVDSTPRPAGWCASRDRDPKDIWGYDWQAEHLPPLKARPFLPGLLWPTLLVLHPSDKEKRNTGSETLSPRGKVQRLVTTLVSGLGLGGPHPPPHSAGAKTRRADHSPIQKRRRPQLVRACSVGRAGFGAWK